MGTKKMKIGYQINKKWAPNRLNGHQNNEKWAPNRLNGHQIN
jgi:hypothetical protein